MKTSFLLDTHTILWFLNGDTTLSKKALGIIKLRSNQCFVSIASLWEITIKLKLGKLQLDTDLNTFGKILLANEIEILQITMDHLVELMELENVHRDPFDRMIISQAKQENIPIITKDSLICTYKNIEVVW